MTGLVAHRGPEGRETRVSGPVGLGFTRLSLVDPAGGGQPFVSADDTLALIANGEVYNHRELAARLRSGQRMHSDSDCEVLLHLYQESGSAFLQNFAGMIAVVVHDARRNRLVLARDRFGIKPLYFHHNGERIVVASEIKALFADPQTPRELDWPVALAHPAIQAAPWISTDPPTTWFRDIEYVEPGTVVEFDLGTGTRMLTRYWSLPEPAERCDTPDAELARTYRDLLADSVADCVGADAEVGLFLSGGIDSASVAAFAARSRRVHTFSVLCASTLLNGDVEYSDRAARAFELPNHQVIFGHDHVPGVEEWLRFVWLMENPMAGPEAYYKHELHRFARATRPWLKGMLLGAASDEFNGGYSADLAGGGGWDDFVANLRRMAGRGHSAERLAPWLDHLGAPLLREHVTERDTYVAYLESEHRKICQYNVWHEDRSAAGSGIEARVPFLDHRLVEFVSSLPAQRRRALLWDKQILRDAMQGILPDEVVDRPKVPFFHGEGANYTHRMVARLLARDGFTLVERALESQGGREFLHPDAVMSMARGIAGHQGPAELANVELLMRLVNLGLLDSQCADPPAPMVETDTFPLPERVELGRAGLDEGLEQRLLAVPTPAGGDVPAWADNVLLLAATDASGVHYLLRDGAVEYVLDPDSAWTRFALAIDGRTPVAELAGGTPLDTEIAEALRLALREELLVVVAKTADATDRVDAEVGRALTSDPETV